MQLIANPINRKINHVDRVIKFIIQTSIRNLRTIHFNLAFIRELFVALARSLRHSRYL